MPNTIETRASWLVGSTAVGIAAVSLGAPYIAVVALKPIAADLGSARSVPALAFALARISQTGWDLKGKRGGHTLTLLQ